ncbi:hypothetical protein B0H13DRAFT_1860277 [Mycena leptocephala]|nr:hypothetical protein B0H13DRAFT_1860277 [Mycena leptocephala]
MQPKPPGSWSKSVASLGEQIEANRQDSGMAWMWDRGMKQHPGFKASMTGSYQFGIYTRQERRSMQNSRVNPGGTKGKSWRGFARNENQVLISERLPGRTSSCGDDENELPRLYYAVRKTERNYRKVSPAKSKGQSKLKSGVTSFFIHSLALFKPWSNTKTSPLKSPDITWTDALNDFKLSMPPEHARVVLNMQLLYQTRDAKFNFAAKRSKRLAALTRMAKDTGIVGDDEGDAEYDPVWENAMKTTVDPDELDTDNTAFSKDTRATRDAQQIVLQASNVGFYSV